MKWYENEKLNAWIIIIFFLAPLYITYRAVTDYTSHGASLYLIIWTPFAFWTLLKRHLIGKEKSKLAEQSKAARDKSAKFEAEHRKNIAEQINVEQEETARKKNNPVVPMSDFFPNPRQFQCVQKHEIAQAGSRSEEFNQDNIYDNKALGAGWTNQSRKYPVTDLHFYVDNYFEATGIVCDVKYGQIPLFDKAADEKKGYSLKLVNGFGLGVQIETESGRHSLVIGLPFDLKKIDPQSSGAYVTVDQSAPLDFLPFKLRNGMLIKAKGSLSKVLKAKMLIPEGFYLVVSVDDIHPVNVSLQD